MSKGIAEGRMIIQITDITACRCCNLVFKTFEGGFSPCFTLKREFNIAVIFLGKLASSELIWFRNAH